LFLNILNNSHIGVNEVFRKEKCAAWVICSTIELMPIGENPPYSPFEKGREPLSLAKRGWERFFKHI
jgi:hypothetical protein